MFEKFSMLTSLTQLGDVYATTHKFKDSEKFVRWTEENFDYVRYNPRKKVERYGLSITSLHGNIDGIPDLDSLYEYNIENNTLYKEEDFKTKTPVYENQDLQQCVRDFEPYFFRTHILKLDPGGYFPPHRDLQSGMNSFRLIVPLSNCDFPGVNFIVDENIIRKWYTGHVHFVNTLKEHILFNASFEPSYWLIMNIEVKEEAIKKVLYNLKVT